MKERRRRACETPRSVCYLHWTFLPRISWASFIADSSLSNLHEGFLQMLASDETDQNWPTELPFSDRPWIMSADDLWLSCRFKRHPQWGFLTSFEESFQRTRFLVCGWLDNAADAIRCRESQRGQKIERLISVDDQWHSEFSKSCYLQSFGHSAAEWQAVWQNCRHNSQSIQTIPNGYQMNSTVSQHVSLDSCSFYRQLVSWLFVFNTQLVTDSVAQKKLSEKIDSLPNASDWSAALTRSSKIHFSFCRTYRAFQAETF